MDGGSQDSEDTVLFFGPISEKEKNKINEFSDKSGTPGPHEPFETWFSTERDILILFEIFGEFYDEEFEKLSYEEKKELKSIVSKRTPKTVEELIEMYPDDETLIINESSNSEFLEEKEKTYNDEETNAHREKITEERKESLQERESEKEEFDLVSKMSQTNLCSQKSNEQKYSKGLCELFSPEDELLLFQILGIGYQEIIEKMTDKEIETLREEMSVTELESTNQILKRLDSAEKCEKDKRSIKTNQGSAINFDVTTQENEKETSFDSRHFSPEDELLLFQILGIGYQEIIENMTDKEIEELKDVVRTTEPKSSEEIIKLLEEISNFDKTSYKRLRSSGLDSLSRVSSSPPRIEGVSSSAPICSSSETNHFSSPLKVSNHFVSSPVKKPDLSHVFSPVAQYIHSHPVPPLIRRIKPQGLSKKKLGEDLKGERVFRKAITLKPLPKVTYDSASIVSLTEVPSSLPAQPKLPKAFGTEEPFDIQIVKHMGRVQVQGNSKENTSPIIDVSVHEMKPAHRVFSPRFSKRK